MTELEAMQQLLDGLPIYATKIGYRGDGHPDGESTDAERAFADALFTVHRTWLEVRP